MDDADGHAGQETAATRLAKADRMAADIVHIADDASLDVTETKDAKGEIKKTFHRDSITRAKLRIETRMWLMARYAPHVYGNAAPKAVETDPPMSFVIHTTPEPDEGEE